MKYYRDSIIAAHMAREFNIRYDIGDAPWDEPDWLLADEYTTPHKVITGYYEPVPGKKVEQIEMHSKWELRKKYYVHKDSYSIFEEMDGEIRRALKTLGMWPEQDNE